jgi:hypothetical protein
MPETGLTLEVLAARLDAYENLAAERDRWYAERDKDRQSQVEKALTAAKEQTASSFAASKEAILKAEEAQRAYNTSHNDLARKMDEQGKATMPRTETESRFRTLEEKVNEVRTGVMVGGGTLQGARAVKDESRANIAVALSVLSLIAAILMKVFG